MSKLIIDSHNVLEDYAALAHVVDFYPHGLKGLVIAYLKHYVAGPPILDDDDDRDSEFMDDILRLFCDSQDHIKMQDGQTRQLQLIMVLCSSVSGITRHIVEHHETELLDAILSPDVIEWGRDYMLVPRSEWR